MEFNRHEQYKRSTWRRQNHQLKVSSWPIWSNSTKIKTTYILFLQDENLRRCHFDRRHFCICDASHHSSTRSTHVTTVTNVTTGSNFTNFTNSRLTYQRYKNIHNRLPLYQCTIHPLSVCTNKNVLAWNATNIS